MRQRQIIVLFGYILRLGGLGTRHFFVAGGMLLDVLHQNVPAFQVEPAMSFKHELQTALFAQTFAKFLLREP